MSYCINHQLFVGLTIEWIFSFLWFYFRFLHSLGWPLSLILRLPLEYVRISLTTFRSVFRNYRLRCPHRTHWLIRLFFIYRLLEAVVFDLLLVLGKIWVFIGFDWFYFLFVLVKRNQLIFVFSFWSVLHFGRSVHIAFSFDLSAFWNLYLMHWFFLMLFMFARSQTISWLGLLNFLLRFLSSILLNPFLSFFLHFFYFLFPELFQMVRVVWFIHFDLKCIIFRHLFSCHRFRLFHSQKDSLILVFWNNLFLRLSLSISFFRFRLIWLRHFCFFEVRGVNIWHILS